MVFTSLLLLLLLLFLVGLQSITVGMCAGVEAGGRWSMVDGRSCAGPENVKPVKPPLQTSVVWPSHGQTGGWNWSCVVCVTLST